MASMIGADGTVGSLRPHVRKPVFDVPLGGFTAFDREDADSLTTLIQNEIIPRLMVAHAVDRPLSAGGAMPIHADDVEALAALALESEADALLAHVEAVVARAVAVDTV